MISRSSIAGSSGSPRSAATNASSGPSTGGSTGSPRSQRRPGERRRSPTRGHPGVGRRGDGATPTRSSPRRRPRDYTLMPASDALRAGGEAGTLTFPSGFDTPHPENNIVYARYFPANPIRKPRTGSRRAARSSCWRSGTPTPRVTSGCASCSRSWASPRCASACRITIAACRRSCRAPTTSSVVQRRPDAAGVPPGGDGRAPRAVVAARPGLRAARPARHEPRIVPGDADRRARAAGAARRRSTTSRRISATWCGAGSRPSTCARAWKATSTSTTLRDLWRPISPWSYLESRPGMHTLLVYAQVRPDLPGGPVTDAGRRVEAAASDTAGCDAAVRPLHDRRRRRSSSSTATTWGIFSRGSCRTSGA